MRRVPLAACIDPVNGPGRPVAFKLGEQAASPRVDTRTQDASRTPAPFVARARARFPATCNTRGNPMSQIVYIVGAVVIVLAILSFIGLA